MSDQGKKKSKPQNKVATKQEKPKEQTPEVEKVTKEEVKEQPQNDVAVQPKEGKPKKKKEAQNENKEEVQEQTNPEGEASTDDKPKERKPRERKSRVAEEGVGTVKSVLSGDSIIILCYEKNAPLFEKQINLSNLIVPKIGRMNKGVFTKDEPFAFNCREFLRKKLIGKYVSYAIETPTDNGGYGLVYLDGESVARMVVKAGWARVKKPLGDFIRPDIDELISFEETASREGKGLFSTKEDGLVREVVSVKDNMIGEMFTKLKNKPQTLLIEQVRSGNSFRALMRDQTEDSKYYELPLSLTGIRCPDYNPQTNESEPFTTEARFFSEHFALHRDVNVIFEAFDKRTFYGTVSHDGRILNEELFKYGLGFFNEWPKSAMSNRFREAERDAKKAGLRVWSVFTEQKPREDTPKATKEIIGTVIEIRDSSLLTILDSNRNEVRVNLSSIKTPRIFKGKEESAKGAEKDAPKDAPKEATKEPKSKAQKENEKKEEKKKYVAFEGKEYLRKRTIGQKVRCVLDYSRTGVDKVEKNFFSVYVDKNNVAVELTEHGFAEASEHRPGEPRSKDYDQILLAETLAKKTFKGMWAPNTPTLNISDLTAEGSETRAKNLLPLLQRAGRLRGIVEFAVSCTKYKVYVPKETCMIPLTLSAIRGPQKDAPFSKEAIALARDICHQREIEFDVTTRDKGGNFVGNAWILLNGKKRNLSTIFLEQGFATVIPGAVRDNDNSTELLIAEEAAKNGRKNAWKDYDPEAEELERQKRKQVESEKQKPKTELVDILVTEIVDASKFYVQFISQEQKQLEELMKKFTPQELNQPYIPQPGELVIAHFEDDDSWYRGKIVKKVGSDFEVFYIDYGNSEVLPNTKIQQLPADLANFPPLAKEARLAYIRAPTLDNEFGHDAAMFLKEMVWDKSVCANIEYRDGETLYLSIGDRQSDVHVNAAILRAGLGRVERVKGKYFQPLIERLREEEDKARAARVYMWQYGDPGSDDEEETTTKKGRK